MTKPNLWQKVRESEIPAGEVVQTQVFAVKRPPFLFSLLLGAFSGFLSKNYIITLTEKNIYFSSLNILTNKPETTDCFALNEVIEFVVKKGMFQYSLLFRFNNGNTFKASAIFRKRPQEGFLNPESLALMQRYLQG